MPPSPGKIHSLPIKVLYSLDSSAQAYVTVLGGKYDIYIHPPAQQGLGDEPVGSCYLKQAVRGVCYASPECIPNSSSDFSIYNLDSPSPSLSRPSRAFAPNSETRSDTWAGKGFLSWILAEQAHGKTLIRGRVVRDHDFAHSAFNDQGGLEGLMAAASAAARGSGQREDADGKGWGLEVCLSLKGLDPGGKEEFRGREEFEGVLRSGRVGGSPGSTPRAAQRPGQNGQAPGQAGQASRAGQQSQPVQQGQHGQHGQNGQQAQPVVRPQQHMPNPFTVQQQPPVQQPQNHFQFQQYQHQPQQHQTQQYIQQQQQQQQQQYHPQQQPQQQARPPQQPVPRANGSSSVPSSSRPSPVSLPPPRPPMAASTSSRLSQSSLPPSSLPMAASSSAGAGPSNHIHSNGSNHSAGSNHSSREITPPPLAPRKSPPPTTPSRERLHALLRNDEKMSPGLAKHLAANPTLLNLLKAVPASALLTLGEKKPDTSNTAGPSKGASEGDSPTGPPTPTPSKNVLVHSPEGCCNCGTKESELWRTKNMKDGSKKKVCNACGLYFNKHKRMRPAELWGNAAHDDTPPPEKKAKIEDHAPVRSSPRLARHSEHANGHPTVPPSAESPRKRRVSSKAPIQPSPRMATRLSTRIDTGGMEGKHLDFSDFSPATLFGTSPAQAPDSSSISAPIASTSALPNGDLSNGMDAGAGLGTLNDGDADLEALLNQIMNPDGGGQFSLDQLFQSMTSSSTAVPEGGESVLDLLGGAWDMPEPSKDNAPG